MGQMTAKMPRGSFGGSSVVPFDLTSIWIPVGIIGLLGIYMVGQFIQERRVSRELILAEAAAAAAPAPEPAAEPAPPHAPVAAPATVAAPAPEKKKAKLRWRTAWIWLPFLIGFFGQAYLTFIKPMMEASGQ